MTSSTTARPRPISKRGWVALAVWLLVVGAALTAVITLYNAEGGSRVATELGASDVPGIIVTVEPVSVDSTKNQATVRLALEATGADLVDDRGRLKQNTRIQLVSFNGTNEAKYVAGDALGQFEVQVGLDGEEALYPFDRHVGIFAVTADSYVKKSDGSLESTGDISVGLQGSGGVNGWDTTFEFDTTMVTVAQGLLRFQRAFSTQAFALVILCSTAVLAILALIISILVFTRRREVEAALLSWTAALLFALPLLRNYMPNSPPVGAAIDAYVYLWVVLAAITATVLMVLGWNSQRRDALRAGQAEGGE